MSAPATVGLTLLASAVLAVGCGSDGTTSREIPSLVDTDQSGVSSPGDSPTTIAVDVSTDVAVARYQACLADQGIIADPDGVGIWITAELSGDPQDGPKLQRHQEQADRAYAACADLQAAIEQESSPPEPDDPDLLRQQAAFGECFEKFGYEFEVTADGWALQQPAQPGTDEFEEWEQRILECEDEVG